MINSEMIEEIIKEVKKNFANRKSFNYHEHEFFIQLLKRLEKTLMPKRRIIELFYDTELNVYVLCGKFFINIDTGEKPDNSTRAEMLKPLGRFASDDDDRKVF